MVEKVIFILNLIRRFGIYSSSSEFNYSYNYRFNEFIKIDLSESDFSSIIVIDFKEPFKNEIFSYIINLKKIDNELLMRLTKPNFRGDLVEEKTDDLAVLDEILIFLNDEFKKIQISKNIKDKLSSHLELSLKELDNRMKVTDKSFFDFKKKQADLFDLDHNPIKLNWICLDFIQNYGFNNTFRLIEFLFATEIFQKYKTKFALLNKDYELDLFTSEGHLYCGLKRIVDKTFKN